MSTGAALTARGVSKRFRSVEALRDVDFALAPGRVHALVGENGAGKSTLAKILAGLVQPDAGQLLVDGRPARFGDRRAALTAGIGLVPQHLSLIGELTLLENHLLDSSAVRLDRDAGRALLVATAERAGIAADVERPAARLSLAERQVGEILLALAAGARVLLLDEPTSSLGPVEVGGLFERLGQLVTDGTSIVLITHRLDEVRRVADEVTVLTQGRVVHHGPVAALSDGELARRMVGELPPARMGAGRSLGPSRLELRGLDATPVTGPPLRGIDLAVAGGEIVGVAGVAGSGQQALVEAIAGLLPAGRGSVRVDDVDVTGDPAAATRGGVGHVPEVRADGLIVDRSVADNATILRNGEPALRRAGMRRVGRIRRFTGELSRRFDVRPPHPDIAAGALSGGNQQKLLVGRELERQPAVVVAHGPTQGLDLRATAAIRADLTAAADAGAAVVVVSADLEEVLALSDRIVVMVAGRIVDELPVAEATSDRLGRSMAGLVSFPASGATPR